MGYYIEVPHPKHKAAQAVDLFEAELVLSPEKFNFDGPDALLCVVENPLFDAIAIAFDKSEMEAFNDTENDDRPRTWLKIPKSLAKELQPNVPL